MQSILHQLPTNPWNKTQVNFLGNENLSPKSNEIQQCIHTIRDPVLATQHLVSFCQVSSFPWFGSQVHAKLRNIFCTSEAWGVFLTKAGCNGNPEAPAAAVLVSLRSSCHVVLKCQTSWKDNGLIQLEDLSQQRSQPQKKQNWFLVAPGWDGNEMEWGNESQWLPKGRLMNPHSLLTRHQPKKLFEV